MNDIEKAIETLREISDIETKRHYSDLHKIKSFNYDLLSAIGALQEKAERDKGCEHCRGWDRRCGANYCPMCGRELEGVMNNGKVY